MVDWIQSPSSDNADPILRRLSERRALWLGYTVAVLGVVLSTLILLEVQRILAPMEHLHYVRPYGLGFVAAIFLAALVGGRGPGTLALLLGELALIGVLIDPRQPRFAHTPRDWVEITLLALIGSLVVLGVDALRSNRRLLFLSQATEARLRTFTGAAPVGVAMISVRGELQYANREAERIWGGPMQGQAFALFSRCTFLSAGDVPIPFSETPLGRVLRGEAVADAREIQMICGPEREPVWVEQRVTAVQDAALRAEGALLILSDVTARKLGENALHARMQRDALLHQIAAAIRAAESPEAIQLAAAAALGRALGAERCFFATVDTLGIDGDPLIVRDYSAEGIAPLAERSDLTLSSQAAARLFPDLAPTRIDDIDNPALGGELPQEIVTGLRALGIRSAVLAPVAGSGAISAILVAAMTRYPRPWSDDDAALAEVAATQVRTAVEAARLRTREHRIATILQEALRPALPERVPGLDLASFYRAALDEASVGGDFFDVIALDPGPAGAGERCALMIGDVSGKGLAAASQVATVRMMLRYALTFGGDMARSLEQLNDTLAQRDWLIGFATLFVGSYDARTGVLEYVSCGHEPGLLRRARTGEVEELTATGAAMGAYVGAAYEAVTVRLEPGDALLLYTDGVSDIGPDRARVLNAGGVARFMAAAPPAASAQATIDHMLRAVERYAGGMQRDDICMLAAIVGAPSGAGEKPVGLRMVGG